MKTVELIVPCYNEEKCIRPFYEEVKRVFEDIPEHNFIITYVDDGSVDNTLVEIIKLAGEVGDATIRYISFSRNFGKESAMYAGLSKCVGDYISVMDVDLQHPPKLLPQMISAIENEDYDCAAARRVSRKGEPKIKSALSSAFYYVFNSLTGMDMAPGSTDYRLMKREVAKVVVQMSERERFTKGIYSWIGFKTKWIEYENVERVEGTSKWNIRGLARYSYNGFMAFATTPLRGVVWLGIVIVVATLIWIIRILYKYLAYGDATGGGITTLTLIVLFLGGMIILIQGMLGEYLARIYMEVKGRPIYIARESNIKEKTIDKSDKAMYDKGIQE